MSFALVRSRALRGLDSPAVTVEVHLANGLPSFTLVGLADTEVKESRERVRAALQTSGLEFPHNRRVTVSLAPADLPKESGRFDLPIALGILAAAGQIDPEQLDAFEFAGELSLGGQLRPVHGALAMALALRRTTTGHQRTLVLPQASADESALVDGVAVRGADHLLDVVRALLPGDAADASGLRAPRPLPRGARPHAARPGRRPRPGGRQARARDRGSRPAEPPDDRAAGHRQVDAGAPPRRRCCRRCRTTKRSNRPPSSASPAPSAPRAGASASCARRITPPRRPRSSAAAHRRARARSRSRTTASCSSTSCPNFRAPRSRRCASRSRAAGSSSRAPPARPNSRPRSSSSRR